MNKKRVIAGFTLIELLIVVAIIAILAAIAVPNFLEAQTRSKVARVNADHRSLAIAIEAYRIDSNLYPLQMSTSMDDPVVLTRLSTPVAYMSNPLLQDPFKHPNSPSTNLKPASQYIYISFQSPDDQPWYNRLMGPFRRDASFDMVGSTNMKTDYPGPYKWFLLSYGPDSIIQLDNDKNGPQPPPPNSYMLYDATNGTKSRGDIYRFGP